MPGEVGNLRDMREFVSYAPRLRSDGHTTILYSGCHYTADDFVQLLGQHISRIDERFAEAMQWFKEKSHDEVWSRLLTSDFILHEYDALRVYYRKSVQKGVGDIYRSLCEAQDIDWKVNRPDPGTWTAGSEEEEWRRRRHQEIIDSWIGPT